MAYRSMESHTKLEALEPVQNTQKDIHLIEMFQNYFGTAKKQLL